MSELSTTQIKSDVIKAAEPYFDFFEIDKQTGILGAQKWNSKRFSGYPHIGDKYAEQKTRVVIVGADLGSDEEAARNTYHRFDTKIKHLPKEFRKCNAHMAGTYATVIYLLRETLKSLFAELYSDENLVSGRTAKIALKGLKSATADSIIPCFAMTNLHKFVTIVRPNKAGNKDRYWLNADMEYAFLRDELIALNPTVVVFQKLAHYNLSERQVSSLREALGDGCAIIEMDHPSKRIRGGYQLKRNIIDLIQEQTSK